MKRTITILLILTSLIGYSQVTIEEKITVHTTLLTIDGISKGHLLKGEPLLPAFEYEFVADDTLRWTTVDINDLIIENRDLLLRIDSLELRFSNLLYEFNEADKVNLKYNDIIMLATPQTTIE